jgi:hypothetical protein
VNVVVLNLMNTSLVLLVWMNYHMNTHHVLLVLMNYLMNTHPVLLAEYPYILIDMNSVLGCLCLIPPTSMNLVVGGFNNVY